MLVGSQGSAEGEAPGACPRLHESTVLFQGINSRGHISLMADQGCTFILPNLYSYIAK